ncbi:major facilitator superfamily domain-containing protein [Aspergillus spectabilis]
MSEKPVAPASQHVDDVVDEKSRDTVVWDAETLTQEKRLVRKLDLTLMPMVWVLYLFNYLDRNNISQAKLNSFEEDPKLQGSQYNTAISILNVGYMLMQLPSNMIITRVRPSIYIALWVCVWSCVSAATGAVHTYGQLIAVRLLLGIAEAPFFPGVFYLLSCWYTKKELALRTAVLYSGLVLATAFSGLLAAGIFSGLDGARGLAGWRWLFIIEGAGSFVAGLVALLLLPDFPGTATGSTKWLFSESERALAIDRIRRDQVSNQESDRSVLFGLKSAVRDIRVAALMLCANHTAYGFNNFYPSIVKGFSLGSIVVTLLCTAPPYIIGAIVAFGVAWSSDRMGERGYHIGGSMAVAVVGFVISVSTLNTPARYFSSFLYICGCFAANSLVYTWAASAFGNIWSPYFFRDGDGPRYILAMILMMAFAVLSIACCVVMKLTLKRDNRKLLARYEGTGEQPNLHIFVSSPQPREIRIPETPAGVFDVDGVDFANSWPFDGGSTDWPHPSQTDLAPSLSEGLLPDDLFWLHQLQDPDIIPPLQQVIDELVPQIAGDTSILSRPGPPPLENLRTEPAQQLETHTTIISGISQVRWTSMQEELKSCGYEKALPSQFCVSKYARRYFDSFHRHQPFLHAATWSFEAARTALILAISASGALYSLESDAAESMYQAAVACLQYEEKGLWTLQTLMILMAYKAWSGKPEHLQTALGFYGETTLLVRREWARVSSVPETVSWEAWFERELLKRVTYCVFTLTTLINIAYDIPAPINLEDRSGMPCHESQWTAKTTEKWAQLIQSSTNTTQCWTAAAVAYHLMSDGTQHIPSHISTFGCHIIISCLVQRIILFRKAFPQRDTLSHSMYHRFLRALRRWQRNWEREPSASFITE